MSTFRIELDFSVEFRFETAPYRYLFQQLDFLVPISQPSSARFLPPSVVRGSLLAAEMGIIPRNLSSSGPRPTLFERRYGD